ncbi:MAG TPA: hypothetical protein VNX68_00540, partial [Nitrosopumilaceae archaeon]|nr:hypothetical protein [Nitrosopumilaceae archaeon]
MDHTKSNRALDNAEFFVLDETDKFVLGGFCGESIYLIDKTTQNEIHLGDLDGCVDFGIISKDNCWAITGREIILLWVNERTFKIDKKELGCLEGVRLIDDNVVELTIDTLNLN